MSQHRTAPATPTPPDGAPEQPRRSVEAPAVEVPDSPEALEYRSEWNLDEDAHRRAGRDPEPPASPR